MTIDIIEINGSSVASISSDEVVLGSVDDALDLIGNAGYMGADGIILNEGNIKPDFFNLKTRMAGEILQKFSQYRMKLAIVGEFTKYGSKSLTDFIYESNKGGKISFVSSLEEAKAALVKNGKRTLSGF